jgi:hypothetical protein
VLTVNPPATLAPEVWLERRRAHQDRVRPWVEPRLDRSGRGAGHPVYDFLFTYYSLRPSQLQRWQPGLGYALAGDAADEFLQRPGYRRGLGGIELDLEALARKRLESIRWIGQLLSATQQRPARFGCHGLHEWAMVYRAEERRHATVPLRLSTEAIARTVEGLAVNCSHFDAFRFFTPAARPLNQLQPTRDQQPELEQPGCLHANMDLYKWAGKLLPLVSGELLADCFALAWQTREIDMRASPYDLADRGFSPIPIETPDGRAEYEALQREIARAGEPLREQLVHICQQAVTAMEEICPR